MVYYKFPDEFIWGSATASAQIEGASKADGKGESIWDEFAKRPGAIALGQTPANACDHYNRMPQDVELMAKLGLKAYRFSIAWPRIFPTGEEKVINEKGLDFYERLIDALLAKNIQPYATLYHWDLPSNLEHKGGWRNRDTAYRFHDYAAAVVKRLGDRVKSWATFNEMTIVVDLGYRDGYHAPGAKEDEKTVRQVNHHTLLAHGLGMKAIRENASNNPKAGIVHCQHIPIPFYECKEDLDACKEYFHKNNAWMLDAIFKGKYPETHWKELGANVPEVKDGDMEIISQPMDYLGFNIYSASNIVHHEYGTHFVEPHFPKTGIGWSINSDVIYWGSRFLHEIYKPKEIYITENGCSYPDDINASGRVDDHSRIEYINVHLKGVHRAISENIPVKGYFVWSFMDNFEWAFGYTKRFGIVFVNYETFQRTPKLSYEWYSKVIANGGF